MGYDYLALHALVSRGALSAVGHRMGVGKESDIHIATDDDGRELVVKIHRLGRTCFRAVRNKRDYLRPGQHATWLYLSRLSALKEFAFMKALHMHGFPVPEPIDVNRHTIVMGLCKGFPLNQVQKMAHPGRVYARLIELYLELASYGLVHCDFNEFNLLVDEDENVTLIDFPQMVSTDHARAKEYFDRDVRCLRDFFSRRYGFEARHVPTLEDDAERRHNLDAELEASGWSRQQEDELQRVDAALERGDQEYAPPLAQPLARAPEEEVEAAARAAEAAAEAGGLATPPAADIAAPRARQPGRAPPVAVTLDVQAAAQQQAAGRAPPVPARAEAGVDAGPAHGDGHVRVDVQLHVYAWRSTGPAPRAEVAPPASSLAEALAARAGDERGSHAAGSGSDSEEGDGDTSTIVSVATANRQAAIARRVRQEAGRNSSRQGLRSAKQGNRSRKTTKRKADGNMQAKAASQAGGGAF